VTSNRNTKENANLLAAKGWLENRKQYFFYIVICVLEKHWNKCTMLRDEIMVYACGCGYTIFLNNPLAYSSIAYSRVSSYFCLITQVVGYT